MTAHRAFPVVLVVSELVTNAWLHSASGGACGRVKIELEHLPGLVIHLSVTDDGPRPGKQITLLHLSPHDDGLQVHERGLRLVKQLSQDWGWSGRPGGALTVWARVDPYRDVDM